MTSSSLRMQSLLAKLGAIAATAVVLLASSAPVLRVEGIVALSGPFVNQTFEAVPFSDYIGNFTAEDCFNVTGEVVAFRSGRRICGGLSEAEEEIYRGKVVLFENMERPPTSDLSGCAVETRYQTMMDAGVLAILSYKDSYPGAAYAYHSGGFPINDGDVPFISVGEDFRDVHEWLGTPGFSNRSVVMQLSCDSENKQRALDVYLIWWARMWALVCLAVAFIAFRTGHDLLSEGATEPTSLGTTVSRNRDPVVSMRGWILLYEGTVMLSVGVFGILGIQARLLPSILGDDVVGVELKNFLTTQLSGASTFSTVLVSMLWFELRKAIQAMQPVRNIFVHSRRLIAFFFGVTVVPEMVISYLNSYMYAALPVTLATSVLLMLNLGVTAIFLWQGRSLLRNLRKVHDARVESSFCSNSPDLMPRTSIATAATRIEERLNKKRQAALMSLAIKLTRWMIVYAGFIVVQVLFIGPVRVLFSGSARDLAFAFVVQATRVSTSWALVMGLVHAYAKRDDTGGARTSVKSSKTPTRTLRRWTIRAQHQVEVMEGGASIVGSSSAILTET